MDWEKLFANHVFDKGFIALFKELSKLSGEGNGTPLQYSCLKKWMEEPGRLLSMGSLSVGPVCMTSLSLFTFMHRRRKWQLTPACLPAESQGQGSLVGCHLWGRTELDTTEVTQQQQNSTASEKKKSKPKRAKGIKRQFTKDMQMVKKHMENIQCISHQ